MRDARSVRAADMMRGAPAGTRMHWTINPAPTGGSSFLASLDNVMFEVPA